jgi:hypothetical protein
VGLLVISRFPGRDAGGGFSPGRGQKKALATWFLAGGRVVVESRETLLAAAGILRKREGPSGELKSRAEWLKFLGGREADVLLWEGDRPLVARFRTGFGRGLYVDHPAGEWNSQWVEAAKAAYGGMISDPAVPCIPLTARRLYNDPRTARDFPTLEGSLVGAGAALRWAVGCLLAVGAAAVLFWRRRAGGRAAAASSLAAAAFAGLVLLAARPPEMLTLSVRVDEFSADGLGVRSREFLYVENPGRGAGFTVSAPSWVLPAPVLFEEAEAGRLSFTLRRDGERWLLADVSSAEKSMFLGAGPLFAALRTEGSGVVLDGPGAAAERAIANCLAERGDRLRPQAEFVAGALLSGALPGKGTGRFRVRRLPDADSGPVLRVEGKRHRSVRLGRVGIFYGEVE